MSIWKASPKTADKGNAIGYLALLLAGFIAVSSFLVNPPWTSILGLASGGLTVVGVFLTFWASSVRDRHSDIAILDAQTAAELAHEKASLAEMENTRLQARLLDQEARHAELLKKFGPRTFSRREIETLLERLSKHDFAGAEVHFYTCGTSEANQFAELISRVLQSCGILCRHSDTRVQIWGDNHGVSINVTDGTGGRAIGDAFTNFRPDFRVNRPVTDASTIKRGPF